jgi:hypothetical protein
MPTDILEDTVVTNIKVDNYLFSMWGKNVASKRSVHFYQSNGGTVTFAVLSTSYGQNVFI